MKANDGKRKAHSSHCCYITKIPLNKEEGKSERKKTEKIKNTTLNIKQLNPQSFSFVRLDIPTST